MTNANKGARRIITHIKLTLGISFHISHAQWYILGTVEVRLQVSYTLISIDCTTALSLRTHNVPYQEHSIRPSRASEGYEVTIQRYDEMSLYQSSSTCHQLMLKIQCGMNKLMEASYYNKNCWTTENWFWENWYWDHQGHFHTNLGAVSIRKTVLPGMAIPMLKIRRPNGRLIFNMEIAICR